ncbi:MAG: DUF2127 domain-containing protein [bacterium]
MWISPTGRLSRWLHWLFEMSLVIKGLLAAGESLSGLGLLLTPNMTIIHFYSWLTFHKLAQSLSDDMAQWVQHVANGFPVHIQHFTALYLLGHGALKFIMVLMLWRRILWAYPAAMAVLLGFVIYQMTEFYIGHSLGFLLLSFFDVVMTVLVFREWNMLKLKRSLTAPAE